MHFLPKMRAVMNIGAQHSEDSSVTFLSALSRGSFAQRPSETANCYITVKYFVKSFGLTCAILCALAGPTNTMARGRPIRGNGLCVKSTQGESQSALPLLRELRVKWVGTRYNGHRSNPFRGRYNDFSKAYQERLAFYRENDIGVVFGLWRTIDGKPWR
jgi:hypothetical protein